MEGRDLMKRKYADRPKWTRIVKSRFGLTHVDTEEFKGIVSLYQMDEVKEALWVTYPTARCCIADNGHAWLQQMSTEHNFVLTTMFDAGGQVIQWYIDICLRKGVDAQGVPWFDDLYLDIVVLPSGAFHLKDADELEAALEEGVITKAEYELAWRVANELLAEIEAGTFWLLDLSVAHRSGLNFQPLVY